MFFSKKETTAEAIKNSVEKSNIDSVLVAATKGESGTVALKGSYENLVEGLRYVVLEMMKNFKGLKFEDVLEDMQVSNPKLYEKPENLSDIKGIRVTFRMKDGRIIGKELSSAQANALVAAFGMRTGADGKFQYMRTTFTQEQYAAGYIHSHCTRLDRSTIRSWHSVCTGHGQDTPINGTIERLMTNKFDPLTWECFFWELEKATGSESLTGGPYIRMSYVESPLEKITTLPMPRPLSVVIADAKRCGFLKDYIKSGLFNIAYLNGRVTIAESFASWLVAFSEFFFKWEEEHTAYMRLPTSTYIVFNDTLYRKKANTNAASYREAGTPVLKFKGKEFNLTITKEENDSTNEKKLITPEIGFVFLNTILNIINTKLAYCEYEERAKIPERKRREVANVYYEANFPNTRAENIKFF